MLLTNFRNVEMPLYKIAIKASKLDHYEFGPAYDAMGVPVPDHTGLYVNNNYANSLEGRKRIELFFTSSREITKKLLEIIEESGQCN